MAQILEIDTNGDVYIIYRNNEQNIRDTYIAVKRYGDDNFSEYFQASNLQDFIGFCPSSGPSINIKDDESFEALLRRFSKKVQQESIVSETRRRQNFESPTSIRKKKISNKKRKSFRTTQKNQQ